MIWEHKLKQWLKAGVIDKQTHQAISQFEVKRSQERPYILYAFLSLGAVAIMTGIISLIAFNWKNISDALKLGIDFFIFITLAISLYYCKQTNRQIVFEILLVLYCLWIPASIGLISQVFNQTGELYNALLLSCALSTILVFFSHKALLPHLWLAAFSFASYEGIFEKLYTKNEASVAYSIYLVSLYSICALFFSHKKIINTQIRNALNVWAVGILTVSVWVFSLNDTYLNLEYRELLVMLLLIIFILLNYVIIHRTVSQLIILSMIGIFSSVLATGIVSGKEWLEAFSCIAVMLGLAVFFASLHRERLFHFFMISAGIRIYVVYLDVFDDLASTGIGLILSGLVFIAMGLIYWFTREWLARMARKVTR